VAALTSRVPRNSRVYFWRERLQVIRSPVAFNVDQGVYTLQIGEWARRTSRRRHWPPTRLPWWSTPPGCVAPVQVKKLDHASPVRTGEARMLIATPKLQIGHTLSTSEKASGTATLCNFEYRGESYPDRGAK